MALSPGNFTMKHTIRLANKLKRKRLMQSLPTTKKRRLELKAARLSKEAARNVLEGQSYKSDIGLEEDVDLDDIDPEPLRISPESSCLMYFDLETTGLSRTSDIIQIAAVCEDRSINVYLNPSVPICKEASAATGLRYDMGQLTLHGEPVPSTDQVSGLTQFVDFTTDCASKPVIVGHNIQNFDLPILQYHLQRHGLLKRFDENVLGFLDTYKLAQKVFDKKTMGNFKQETLVRLCLGKSYDAHNALADVCSLRELYESNLAFKCESSDIFNMNYYNVKSSLIPLIQSKVISTLISKRLTANNLSLNKLKLIHKRDPHCGIQTVFSEVVSGSKTPRITKSQKIIGKVVEYLNSC
ncbi:uncharacterized protein LOC133191040 [Saccostrea echinata]|uniref:uncharacterized protein LOC133181977 n=1 Tax=Saccostrea echinata TaxID=191078 RepID=UPI002A813CBB|nr:uncharacterized protein LOC133181977 [Saccostrea echinata]XP_061172641.1 uncharacterized protein LOC133181977 [Saccostrea echinata]XP_061182683.1 uncharacterized protein LOC133191040 [Saccostrea echinata]XP_061182684.1 uncharacterized protein LOC133191040 [Saccostrea echinata]